MKPTKLPLIAFSIQDISEIDRWDEFLELLVVSHYQIWKQVIGTGDGAIHNHDDGHMLAQPPMQSGGLQNDNGVSVRPHWLIAPGREAGKEDVSKRNFINQAFFFFFL